MSDTQDTFSTVEFTDEVNNLADEELVLEISSESILVNLDIEPVTEDGKLNFSEANSTVTVTGTVYGDDFDSGVVTLVVNDVTYMADVDSNGAWSIDVEGSDLNADSDNEIEGSVVVSNNAGQEGSASTTETYVTDTSARGVIRVDSITSDDTINSEESSDIVTVSGRVGFDVSEGDVVTITVNGTDYTTLVLANNTWSVDVEGSDLAAADSFMASVSGEDDSGNSFTATTTSTHTIDLEATTGTVSIDGIVAADVIDAAVAGETIAVTGSIFGGDIDAGDTVTLEVNGETYTTVVAEDGTWSVDVEGADLAEDTEVEVSISSSDEAGNTVESVGSITYLVDTPAEAGTVTVDIISEDGVINADDTVGIVTITGNADGGDISTGDTVTLEVNGTEYTTIVEAGGTWSVDVAGSDLAEDTEIEVSVTSSNDFGNTVESTSNIIYSVDTVAESGTVTVDAITEDDVINAAEVEGTITMTGTASEGDIEAGDTVTLEVNSTEYTTTVAADGTWSVEVAGSDLAADTEVDVNVVSSDEAGNTVTSSATSTHTVDTSAVGQIDIDRITSDSIISSGESTDGTLVAITGYVGNDASPGDTITVTVNGIVLGEGTVSEEQNDSGKYLYSVEVLGSDLASTELANPVVVVTVSGEDDAGNAFSAQSTEIYKVDTFADLDVFVSEESGDNVLNFDEAGNLTVGGFIESGGDVTSITITDSEGNSITFTDGVTLEDDGGYTSFETNLDVSTLADGDLTVLVTATDGYGNESSLSETIEKDTSADAGTVTVDAITEDDILSSEELDSDVEVSGTASGGDIAEGDVVTLDINGTTYTTTVNAYGEWSVDVSGENLAAVTTFDAVVTSSDSAGNTVESSTTSNHSVNLATTIATVTAVEGGSYIFTDLPDGFTFPGGETEVETALGGTITLEDGVYTYTAPVVDHDGEDSLADSVTITLDDGRTYSFTVDIEDSAPTAVDDEASVTVSEESFTVSDVEVNWTSYTDGTSVTTFDGTTNLGGVDNDDALDQIRWGSAAGGEGLQSGYGFVDNDDELNGEFELNEDIVLGTFTHYNYPVYSGGAITAASMEVTYYIKDASGESQPVTLTVNYNHNETLNVSGDDEASRDIVTVESTYVTFEWEGDIYTLQVVGFTDSSDPDSDVVSTIYTYEDAATSYDLVVRIVEGDGYSLPETSGNVLDDNGLGADELSEDGSLTVISVSADDASDSDDDTVGTTIEGTYGTLTLNADGSYVYQATSDASVIPDGAVDTFSYTIEDEDGSTSTAELSVNVTTDTYAETGTVVVESITDTAAPVVTISITDDSDTSSNAGYDYITEDSIVDETLDSDDGFGRGNDSITVNGSLSDIKGSSNIDMYGGDDTIIVADNIRGSVEIDMGSGDDTLEVAGNVRDTAQIDLGSGDDTVNIIGNLSSSNSIEMGKGDDTVTIGGNVRGEIHMDKGDDFLSIVGNISDTVDGGSNGTDYLYLESYSYDDYVNDVDHICTQYIKDFEYIQFNDGTIYDVENGVMTDDSSVASVFENGTAATTLEYSYTITLSSEANTVVTLDNLPDGVTVEGADESDGVYTVTTDENGDATVTLQSNTEIDESDLSSIAVSAPTEGMKTVAGTAEDSNISAGDTVTLEVNGNLYTTVVLADSTWSVEVAESDLEADNEFDVTVTSTDSDGGTVETSISYTYTPDSNDSSVFEDIASNLDDSLEWFENNTGNDEVASLDENNLYSSDSDADISLKGASTIDTVYSGSGDDHIEGQGNDDVLDGGIGDDFIEGGNGADTLFGSEGSDLLLGNNGRDTLFGGDGDDFLFGNSGADTLYGGNGNDLLSGGNGFDTLTGGNGSDLFILSDTKDTITDFNASDDALDLSDLLIDIDGEFAVDSDAIQAFLESHISVTDGSVELDGEDVATFEETSIFDSNNDGSVNASDSLRVLYNDTEYSINIDG
ncbi:Ig-like domain-containing protein [Marinomonas sp.]|nr:Ig-like domain-containing protein [Marinomonas sp.]MDB4837140.1 Ig-like domain-containing protein [Marinomonas sp.]